jgi:hypothetical protein
MKKDGVVSASHGKIFLKTIGDRLPTLPRRPSVATPSARRGILTENLLNSFLKIKQRVKKILQILQSYTTISFY